MRRVFVISACVIILLFALNWVLSVRKNSKNKEEGTQLIARIDNIAHIIRKSPGNYCIIYTMGDSLRFEKLCSFGKVNEGLITETEVFADVPDDGKDRALLTRIQGQGQRFKLEIHMKKLKDIAIEHTSSKLVW